MGKYIDILRKDNLETSNWSGGTTTQLYIYPEDSIYSERDFKWRISTAKVELDESEFTKLPNIKRKIMILEGELLLEHKGHHRVTLSKFEQDSFLGDWVAKSYGKVTDFNLMLGSRSTGNIEYIKLDEDIEIESYNTNKEFSNVAQTFYCLNGSLKISVNSEEVILHSNDFAVVKYKSEEDLIIKLNNIDETSLDIISCLIYYL